MSEVPKVKRAAIPEEDLVALLQREDAMRRSDEYQSKMLAAEQSVNSEWMDVATEIQTIVVSDYLQGQVPPVVPTPKKIKSALRELRAAALRHPEIAHYVKFNRVRDCPAVVGDVAPDIQMFRPLGLEGEGRHCRLLERELHEGPRALVLISGSLS